MMQKIILLLCLSVTPIYSNIALSLATHDDLPELMDLDRIVSVEDFGTFVPPHYTEYFTAQQYIDGMLAEVNTYDLELFKKSIDCIDNHRVHVAVDEQTKKLIGFAIYFKQDKMLKLESIAVDKNWRRKGVASKLINAAINHFKDIDSANLL
jgi:ribosomal protein S18 acetylase RimI-like enzyme